MDKLDRDAILGDVSAAKGDIATFIGALREVIKKMEAKVADGQEYNVLDLHRDLKRCYTQDVFEREILKKMKISQRLDRILGKALAPIHEDFVVSHEVNGRAKPNISELDKYFKGR